ncbi:MAG TPA: hypothetical protein PLU95_03910 [Syntrophales bacterium]|nr:hypothetical protein [Syntrophales bacterium]HOD98829.1 hypothetical protein [Syntrophales bacterium]HPN08426.1 hypothetical protein [Syntrophales bacterium]HPX82122.1 hypothetical protein [Syntrophales bacterium]HQB14297.1 hypothetical protein [Syntrophales bacterium]
MTGRGDKTGERETWADRAAALIRERSAAAELISGAELRALPAAENLAGHDATEAGDTREIGDNGEAGAALLARLLEANDDLREISGADSCSQITEGDSSLKNTAAGPPYYYSSLYLTEAYARLLVHKRAGPLQLIAATVREFSGAYRRPLAVDMFMQPPFLFTEEGMRTSLDRMAQTAGFEDIAATSAATGATYLYSKRFLDEGHAAMLAEWLDVGQAANP